jgi:chorismate dehydratase
VAIKNNVIGNFHAIFQDAFSPNKNQTLWTVEWFHFLKKESYHNVALSTYSASVSIRKSLVVAGWIIENHKGYSLKRSMTTASLTGVIDDLLLDQLAKSPTIELYDI